MSARLHARGFKVARTIAGNHVAEAIQYRRLDRA